MIKSQKGIERMREILQKISTAPSPQMTQLETQIYHAFGISGNLVIEERTLEEILLEILEARGMKRWWGVFQKSSLTDSSLGAICNTLGKIGTEKSIKFLNKLEKSSEASLIPKVKEALKRIEERSGSAKL